MLPLTEEILTIIVVSTSLPLGYLLGLYTESEIEDLAEWMNINKIFGSYIVVLEAIVLTLLAFIDNPSYGIAAGIMILLNLILAAMHSAAVSNLGKTVRYQAVFLVVGFAALAVAVYL